MRTLISSPKFRKWFATGWVVLLVVYQFLPKDSFIGTITSVLLWAGFGAGLIDNLWREQFRDGLKLFIPRRGADALVEVAEIYNVELKEISQRALAIGDCALRHVADGATILVLRPGEQTPVVMQIDPPKRGDGGDSAAM